jgi:hypothetical protein
MASRLKRCDRIPSVTKAFRKTEAVMCVFASLTSRLAAGLAGPALALALAAPAHSADIIYERGFEFERYSEPPPVYAPPVYPPPAYVPRGYRPPPAYILQGYAYRGYDHVGPPPGAMRYDPYRRHVEIEPGPPAPIYAPPGRPWSAHPRELSDERPLPAHIARFALKQDAGSLSSVKRFTRGPASLFRHGE